MNIQYIYFIYIKKTMFRGKMEMVATFTFKGKASGGNVVCIFFLLNTKMRYKNLRNKRKMTKKEKRKKRPNSREKVGLILISPINLNN